jgi:phenylacetate-CoA ligase
VTGSPRPIVSPLSRHTRETMRQHQHWSLQELLRHVWKHSPFYRDYYGSHGIQEKDLAQLTVADLPFLSKQSLMDNFDTAVTHPGLQKRELEQWVHDNPDPLQNFRGDFIVINSSGSSGYVGTFVYNQKAWRVVSSVMAGRLPVPENYPLGKTRAAFYLATHGHFGGVSGAVRVPKAIYETLILSLLDSRERVVEQLNRFQPHRLHGYSSSISMLAESAVRGELRIHPRSIFVGGDKLTAGMEESIRQAWRAPIYCLYSAAEAKYLAFKETDQDEMTVMDDLAIMEVLNEGNRPVPPGGEGRVVLTNLYNYTLPILRYELGDYVVLGTAQHDSPYTTIRDIKGRVNDALPVMLRDGKDDTIHPIILAMFYVPGLERVQFISERPDHIRIDYTARHDIDSAVRQQFHRILIMKGALQTTFAVRRVQQIASDTHTGKLRLVRTER